MSWWIELVTVMGNQFFPIDIYTMSASLSFFLQPVSWAQIRLNLTFNMVKSNNSLNFNGEQKILMEISI